MAISMMKVKTAFAKPILTSTQAPAPRKKITLIKGLMITGFIIYCFSVLYLVILERWLHGRTSFFHYEIEGLSRLAQMQMHFQPVPFYTIQKYLSRLDPGNPLRRFAVLNLAGNLALFFPMGFFLPYFWKAQKNPFCFLLTMTVMISAVEITQLFTMLGACDIDDLILNLIGATVGFLIFHIMYFIERKLFHAGYQDHLPD